MKAAVFEEVERLVLKEVPKPKCEAEGLLVSVRACAICGTDVKIFHHGHLHIRPPRILGHEVSGEIVEVGKNLSGYHIGERVAVAAAIPCDSCHYCRKGFFTMCENLSPVGYHFDGGFAEFLAVPPVAVRTACVNRIPEGVTFEEAAIAEPLACALNGQELSRVEKGDTILILGAGPLGCMHVRVARFLGSGKVILSDISSERLALAKRSEPDVLIDSSKEDLKARVMEETSGRGGERVIVACGSPRAQEEALSLVARRGSVNFFGGLPKGKSIIRFDSNLLHYGEFFVVGTHGSTPEQNRKALDLIATGKVKVKDLISKVIPLREIHEGIRMAESGQFMKIIVKP